MVDITPMIPADRQVIDGFGPGQFCVASKWRDGAVIVLPTLTLAWEGVTNVAALTVDDFQPVLDAEPKVELLLLGCGARHSLPPKALRLGLREYGIVVEAMDSAAACRTFNVCLAEGRRVAAALLPL